MSTLGTLSWRLTLWYGAMAIALLILFSPLAFYLSGAEPPLSIGQMDQTHGVAEQVGRTLEKTGSPSQAVEAVQEKPEVWVFIRDAGGAVLASTPGAEEAITPNTSSQSYQDGQREGDYFVTRLPGGASGETVEVYTKLSVMNPVTDDSSLRRLFMIQLLGVAIGLVLMLGLGPRLARGALRPLRKVSAVAKDLSQGKLESRVDLPDLKKRRDEVGEVATSFDAMAESLEKLFKAERESKESLRRFLADASHELRTPLTSILGYLDVLPAGADESPEIRRRAYAAMREEGSQMAHLVEGLLTLARLESHQETPSQPVDLATLVRDVSESYPKRRIEVSAPEPLVLIAEPYLLRQIVSNLLSNAVKYTPLDKGIGIFVERRNTEAVLRVSDEGVGISEENLPHIFERFYRAGGSQVGEGTGLGLAIVKESVEALGGRVEVKSALNKGSTFTVRLPLRDSG